MRSVDSRSSRAAELRRRAPVALVVIACVTAVVAAVSGAAKPMPGMQFLPTGHWVYNSVLQAAFHIDGATASVDAQAGLRAEPGSQVVQSDTDGYVVGHNRITQFGKSNLTVEQTVKPPNSETPVGIEAAGGPYLVYRAAGQVVRLGEPSATIATGGPVGNPAVTTEGTLWLFRSTTGLLCELPKGANRISSCPAVVPPGHNGALTMVGDHPEFVDMSALTASPVSDTGLGKAVPFGVTVSPDAQLAANDIAGKLAILDQHSHRMYLVDAQHPGKPVTVPLPANGEFDAPASTGSAVALLNKKTNTLVTYNESGKQTDSKPLPKGAAPRVSRGQDNRIYVEGSDGANVLVVDQDGKVSDVPVVTKNPGTSTPPNPPNTNQPDQPQPNPKPPSTSTPQQPPVTNPPPVKPKPTTPPPPDTSNPKPPPTVPASPPGAPSGVSATAGSGSATVHWNAAADNRAPITKYVVTWSGGSTTASASARSATASGLKNGTQYTLTVRAYNKMGAGPAVSASPVTPAGAASAPTGLSTKLSGSNVTVSWSAPAMNGGTLQHYSVTATGQTAKTTTSTSATFPAPTSGSATYTVKAVTRAGGKTQTGAAASTTYTVPDPKVVISRGAATQSSNCTDDCGIIHIVLSGFAPGASVTLDPQTSDQAGSGGHEFDDPHSVTVDSSGNATYDGYESDMQGQYVWFTYLSGGIHDTNFLYWD